MVVQVKHGMKYKSMHDFEIRNSKFEIRNLMAYWNLVQIMYITGTDYTAVFSNRYKRSVVSRKNPSIRARARQRYNKKGPKKEPPNKEKKRRREGRIHPLLRNA